MRYLFFLPLITIFLFIICACREDFEYLPSTGQLEFSKDTVFLDTIFSSIGSATYTLKVYNRTKKDILIPSIRLQNGEASDYRLNVDGEAGNTFNDIPLLSRDSLYIFVETTYQLQPPQGDTFLYTDAILFDSGPLEQKVPLVTLIKDAIFLYPAKLTDGSRETLFLQGGGMEQQVQGFFLPDGKLHFTDDKPYVIYGYAAVANGKTLLVDAGARVYFHKDSGIYIASGGSLQIRGSLSQDQNKLEGEILFEGDRLEGAYRDIPGQWNGIWMAEGSGNNYLEYLTIRNALTGIFVQGGPEAAVPVLEARNTRIFNSSMVNLYAKNTHLLGENLVLGQAGFASLLCENGGSYTFRHTTIANFWSLGTRVGPALLLSNPLAQNSLQNAAFSNSIIDGNISREIRTDGNATSLSYLFSHCLIRYSLTIGPGLDFTDADHFVENVLNGQADFLSPADWDFRIGPASDVLGKADPDTARMVPLDLLGNDRKMNPDIGAYQHLEN